MGILTGRDEQCAEHEGDDGHGKIDEEDRTPPKVFEQNAPADRSQGNGESDDGGPSADRLRPFHRINEHIGEDGERRREHQRRTHTHEPPGHDQLRGRCRRRGVHRESGKEQQTYLKCSFTAHPVADTSTDQQQGSEHQRICIDDPLKLARGRAEGT